MFKNRFRKLKNRNEEDEEEAQKGPHGSHGPSDDDHVEHTEDNPPGYEGKEHVHYEDPGYSKHDIRYPEDEPHMKSYASKQESHEMEDDFHTEGMHHHMRLPKYIKRAHMTMEDEHPFNVLVGNLISSTQKPVRDDDGQEREGPNEYQEDSMHEDKDLPGKEYRKKAIAAVMKRKMKKNS